MEREAKLIRVATLAMNVIFGLVLPVNLLFTLFSPMIFDAPGSLERFFTQLIFWSCNTGPIVILLSIIQSRTLISNKLSQKAFAVSLLPLINAILICIAIWGINTFQNGKF